MAFASATVAQPELPRLQLPTLSARQAQRLAGKGLALGLFATGAVAVLCVSLSVASVWTRAVSLNAPTRLHAETPTAPLIVTP